MSKLTVDTYLVETLMRDLVEHDRQPSAFIVYFYLWHRTNSGSRPMKISHHKLAGGTGLSKSSIQSALKLLNRRKLVRTSRASATAVPEHCVLKPWIRTRSPAQP